MTACKRYGGEWELRLEHFDATVYERHDRESQLGVARDVLIVERWYTLFVVVENGYDDGARGGESEMSGGVWRLLSFEAGHIEYDAIVVGRMACDSNMVMGRSSHA